MSTETKLSRRRRAFVSEALMLRALHDYRAARDKAEKDGLSLTDVDLPKFASL